MCRKQYDSQRVKKLHVEPQTANIEEDNIILQIGRHMRRLASVSGESTPEATVRAAIADASAWLAAHTPVVEGQEQRRHVMNLVSHDIRLVLATGSNASFAV